VDTIDHAQEREAAYHAEKLEQQLRAAKLDAAGNEICADCGDPIPLERRRAMPSAIRCIVCQAWAERVEAMRKIA
jgi:DnaK suppressor protein